MENQNQNNQGNQNGNNLPANNGAVTNPPANGKKGGLKGLLNATKRLYDTARYSKTGKWVAKIVTLAALGTTAKVAYDKGVVKGKASVTPTVVTIERIPDNAEKTTEAPAEEINAEETV